MNRLFGKGKPKEPAPNLTDCVSSVSIYVLSVKFSVNYNCFTLSRNFAMSVLKYILYSTIEDT